MKYHRVAKWSTYGLLVSSIVLYIAFMLCDTFFDAYKVSSILKYCSIVLCLMEIVILFVCSQKKKDQLIVMVAFVFTAIADIFLLFTSNSIYGVLSFCVVQLLYLYRIYVMAPFLKKYHLLVRVLLSGIALGVLHLLNVRVDGLLCVTLFYFINFAGNLVLLGVVCKVEKNKKVGITECSKERKTEQEECSEDGKVEQENCGKDLNNAKYHYSEILKSNLHFYRFFVGMILFFLCDLCVGIYNISAYVTIDENVYRILEFIASYGMWGFYLPGQVCIALSTKME